MRYVFAVNEQIKIIYSQPHKDSKLIKKKVFELLYTLPQFKKVAKANPLFYIGTHKHKAVNLEAYYYYLVNSTNLLSSNNKLRKFIELDKKYICGSCGNHCNEYSYNKETDIDECNDCKSS